MAIRTERTDGRGSGKAMFDGEEHRRLLSIPDCRREPKWLP